MALSPEVQAAITRLTAGQPSGYNNGDYNASSNPFGFSKGGHRVNLFLLTADVSLVGDALGDAADDAATSATEAKQTALGIGYYGPVAASDETTPIAIGNGKVTFRMPYAFELTEVRASLNSAQAAGAVFTVDIKRWTGAAWVSIFSTPLTFDNGERTTMTAAVPAVLSTLTLADDDELRIDVIQASDTAAKGLKVLLKGHVPA